MIEERFEKIKVLEKGIREFRINILYPEVTSYQKQFLEFLMK